MLLLCKTIDNVQFVLGYQVLSKTSKRLDSHNFIFKSRPGPSLNSSNSRFSFIYESHDHTTVSLVLSTTDLQGVQNSQPVVTLLVRPSLGTPLV